MGEGHVEGRPRLVGDGHEPHSTSTPRCWKGQEGPSLKHLGAAWPHRPLDLDSGVQCCRRCYLSFEAPQSAIYKGSPNTCRSS